MKVLERSLDAAIAVPPEGAAEFREFDDMEPIFLVDDAAEAPGSPGRTSYQQAFSAADISWEHQGILDQQDPCELFRLPSKGSVLFWGGTYQKSGEYIRLPENIGLVINCARNLADDHAIPNPATIIRISNVFIEKRNSRGALAIFPTVGTS